MPLENKTGHVATSQKYPVKYRKIIKKLLVMEVSATDEGHRVWRSVIGVFILLGAFFVLLGYNAGPAQFPAFINFFGTYVLVLLLFFILVVFYEFLYVWTYYYDIGETFVKIRKGVLLRREVSIPYHQIQDVNVDQDILDHVFRLYDVHISTATEKYLLDPHIDGLSYSDAERILEMIHSEIEELHIPPVVVAATPPQPLSQ